ncbi:hypothetical protein [Sinorhizobium fredii]|uniref:hypothetical protein n=1 Tax=Rhizobium fredii TaxID=380 RepID=UPI00351614CF
MSKPTNREIGQAWTAYILGELFESWPRRLDLNRMDLETKTSIGPRDEPEAMFDDLVAWLSDNNLIALQDWGDGNAYNVSLTDRGLAILGESLGLEQKPVGSVLRKVASGAASETGRALIAETVGLIIGSAGRAFA